MEPVRLFEAIADALVYMEKIVTSEQLEHRLFV